MSKNLLEQIFHSLHEKRERERNFLFIHVNCIIVGKSKTAVVSSSFEEIIVISQHTAPFKSEKKKYFHFKTHQQTLLPTNE